MQRSLTIGLVGQVILKVTVIKCQKLGYGLTRILHNMEPDSTGRFYLYQGGFHG